MADRPMYDAAREERLRWLLVEFALSTPSAKTFDLDEMKLLRDDVEAMVVEIDRLRGTPKDTPRIQRLSFITRNGEGMLVERPNGELVQWNDVKQFHCAVPPTPGARD